MRTFFEALLLFAPLALLALFVFRADRGDDPGNVFAKEPKPEDEATRIRRQNGDAGGGYFFGSGDSGGDGGGGGGD